MKKTNAVAKATTEEKGTTLKVVKPTKETKNNVSTNVQSQQEPTIEELIRKTEKMGRLADRWERLNEKKKRIENFMISHDRDSATMRISDNQGNSFESVSPKTLEKIMIFWVEEFDNAIKSVEEEIKELNK